MRPLSILSAVLVCCLATQVPAQEITYLLEGDAASADCDNGSTKLYYNVTMEFDTVMGKYWAESIETFLLASNVMTKNQAVDSAEFMGILAPDAVSTMRSL